MAREDVIRELANFVRIDHPSATFAVGWLARDCSTEVLEDLLTALREDRARITAPGHFRAYQERWGVVPR